MRFTISQLRDYLWCEQYSHNLHVARRGPWKRARPLWLGELFHLGMANRLRGLDPLANAPSEPLDPGVEDEFRQMLPFLNTWQVPSTWTVEAVEQALEVPVGRHQLAARPDAIITDASGRWLAQWKTLSRSFDLGTHQERVRLSFHECGYHFAVATRSHRSVDGTILGTYKKLTKRELADGRDPFTLVRLPRTWSEVVAVVDDMARVADRMEESIRSNQHLRNLDSCYGRFGNSECPFYQVCWGSSSLRDPQFTDLPDRYSDLINLEEPQ